MNQTCHPTSATPPADIAFGHVHSLATACPSPDHLLPPPPDSPPRPTPFRLLVPPSLTHMRSLVVSKNARRTAACQRPCRESKGDKGGRWGRGNEWGGGVVEVGGEGKGGGEEECMPQAHCE